MIESILENSHLYNILMALKSFYKNSCVTSFLSKIRDWYFSSNFHNHASTWISSESKYKYSLIYRFIKMLMCKLEGIALRLHKPVYPFLEGSIFNSIDYSIPVYLLTLYVFIDYFFRSVPGLTAISACWDELFFAACIFLWFFKWFFVREKKPFRSTSLDFPIFILIGASIFLLFFKTPYFNIGVEGLRAFIQHILWYFIVIQFINSFRSAKNMYKLLVIACSIVGFYGVFQFIVGVETPAHWTDQAEKAVTRIFSIVKSPNILGSLMVLVIPMSMALFFAAKKQREKIVYFSLSSIMLLALVLTSSRGAWLGFAFAMMVYFLQKDKRKYVPVIIVCGAALLLIPQVWSRISYMLSPQYIESSMRGGRLNRLPIGLKMFAENLWVGVGLGHFGGAVAANNNIEGTFYMDNYYLKTAVETGITGLGVFLFLVFNAILQSWRSIKNIFSYEKLQLCLGALAGMSGVLIHNLFENVFEVPMMVIYFWMTAGFIILVGILPSESLRND